MKKKIDYRALALQVVADECKKSFFFFLKTFWSVIIPEEPVYNWHIPYLCNELQTASKNIVERKRKLYDIVINIPPGSTKSTIVTVMWPAWLWTQDASLRIISNSYSGDLSTEHASLSKDIITSDRYKTLFPNIKIRHDKSGKSAYGNTKRGARYTTSTQGTITGKHAHVIINDDPVNPKQADSEPLRHEANKHTGTLSSRKVDKKITVTVTIMQRLHEDDVTGHLLKKKGEDLFHICLPAELSDKVKPEHLKEKYINGLLDPVRIDRAAIDEAKKDLGSRGYANQFEQAPSPAGGNIIKEDWFRTIPISQFLAIVGNNPMHFWLDTAYDEQKPDSDNDPSGIIAACRIQNNVYIFQAQKMYKTFPQLIKFLPEFLKANMYSRRSTLRVEPKSCGKSVVQTLQDISDLNVTETPTPTDSKSMRLHVVSPKVECGRVYLVEGSWNEELIKEICGFPTASHDEYVDLLGYLINYLLEDDFEIPKGLTKQKLGL